MWAYLLHLVSMYVLPGLFVLLLVVEVLRLLVEIIADIVDSFDYSKKLHK